MPRKTTKKKATRKKATKPRKPRSKGAGSGLDAAAKVLADATEPLNAKGIVERMLSKGIWKTNGKTPHATIHAAISREIARKGSASRFKKAGRGQFTISS